MTPAEAPSIPSASGELVARQLYPDIQPGQAFSTLDRIRIAARNRFLVTIAYKGSERLIEPYSLRYPATGNEILYTWEVKKNGYPSNQQKAFISHRITYISTSNQTFKPKWNIEL